MGFIIPWTHCSGIIPVWRIILKRFVYIGNICCSVYLICSLRISSIPGVLEFFSFLIHLEISSCVMGAFRQGSSSCKFISADMCSLKSRSLVSVSWFRSLKNWNKVFIDGFSLFWDLLMLFRYFQYSLGECLDIFAVWIVVNFYIYLYIYSLFFYIACFHGSVNFYLRHFCSFDIVFWLLCI